MRLKDYSFNEASGSYEKEEVLFDKRIRVSVAFAPGETTYQTLEEFILQAEKRLDWLRSNKDLVEQELIKLYPGWLDEEDDWEENPVTEAEFVGRMTLTSSNFLEDLSFYLCYDDGDTFWGHGIMVNFSRNCSFIDTTLFG